MILTAKMKRVREVDTSVYEPEDLPLVTKLLPDLDPDRLATLVRD
jgi:hypothetical protein